MIRSSSAARPRPIARRLLATLALAAAAAPLAAQAPLAPRLEVTGGVSLLDLRTRVRVDGSVTGTTIGAEEDLGLRRRLPSPGVRLRWRPWRRHELELGGELVRRQSELRLAGDVVWRDSVYRAGALVRTRLDADNVQLTWRAALVQRTRTELGLGVTAGALLLHGVIDAGVGVANAGDTSVAVARVAASTPAPVAAVGLYGRRALGTMWRLDGDARALGASVGRARFAVLDARLALRRAIGRHLAIEAAATLQSILAAMDREADAAPGALGLQARYRQLQGGLGIVWMP